MLNRGAVVCSLSRGFNVAMTLKRAVLWYPYGTNECLRLKEEISMDALKLIAQDSLKQELPVVRIGDTVKVHVRIKEGERERIQLFEGTVIAKKHGGVEETFTVRRVAHGVGIERVFPIHSPTVAKVEVVRQGRVRRAKLYYLRDRVGKAAKVKEARH
jgi:large subunit ribosomal protein L19